MKKIIFGILNLVFFVFIIGCSRSTEPQVRILNEQSNKINMNIHTAGNNKVSINDIEPGETTEYKTVSEGNITAIAVVQNESVSFLAVKNTHYTIVISTGKPPSVLEDK